MTEPNPYEANFKDSDLQVPAKPPSHAKLSGLNAAVLAELGIKLLGLMFIVDGISLLISNAIMLVLYDKEYRAADLGSFMEPGSVAGIGQSFVYLLAGVYLLTKGKTVIELILMTDRKEVSDGVESE